MNRRDVGHRVVYTNVVDGEKEYGELVAFVGKDTALVRFDNGRYGLVSEHELTRVS